MTFPGFIHTFVQSMTRTPAGLRVLRAYSGYTHIRTYTDKYTNTQKALQLCIR